MPSQNDLSTHKVATIVSLALSIYGNVRYFVGRSPYDKNVPFNVAETPFSANMIVVLVFWALLHVMQVAFVAQVFVPSVELHSLTSRADITRLVGWHFTLFNVGQFVWTLLFVRSHFFFAEVVVVLNILNVLALYFSHRTYSIKPYANWALIHLPTAAFPFSWLLYAFFWNGAVLLHVHKFVGRVISNVLVWDFLLTPGAFLFLFNDYGVGIASSILTFGLGLGQLFNKLFALQWIFAFVISGILFVLSVLAAITGSLHSQRESRVLQDESAPLLNA